MLQVLDARALVHDLELQVGGEHGYDFCKSNDKLINKMLNL